ncbi:MAG: hypothetical protein WBD07_03910 [Vicinamibacterales bacterium]
MDAMVWWRARTLVLVIALSAGAAPGRANPASERLRARAAAELYNLDRERAIATFREAVVADPQDAGAYRGLASALWLSITFRRGNMTVDDYVGRVNRPSTTMAAPPPETAAAFADAIDRAIALARGRVAANARDADAHYELGAAIGLRASYIATVEGSVIRAFRAAGDAYDAHERVLQLDPRRKDAGLIIGTYRYIVSTQSLPVRLAAYAAGFGGGKERGIRMIEEAVAYGGDNQADARFALVLIYNREQRYDAALKELSVLRERYPDNRLAWLESGSTNLRAVRPKEADRFISEGLARFAGDVRPRMFGEDALWYYKRGAARAALGQAAAAEQDLRKSLSLDGRMWVHGRTRLELGKLALGAGKRDVARQELEAAVTLCAADNDPLFAAEARKLLAQKW